MLDLQEGPKLCAKDEKKDIRHKLKDISWEREATRTYSTKWLTKEKAAEEAKVKQMCGLRGS